MAKKGQTESNKKNNYPDPVFFQRIFVPIIQVWVKQHGGMENILKQDPKFARLFLEVIRDSKENAQSWLTSNFSFAPSEIRATFNKMEQDCEKASTELSGELDFY